MDKRTLWKESRWFLIPYVLLFAFCAWVLCVYPKGDIHMAVNRHYSAFGDFFFKWITQAGTFTVIVPVCIFLFFRSVRQGVVATSATVSSWLLVQFFKRVVFDMPRPKVFFNVLQQYAAGGLAPSDAGPFHVVDGIRLHSWHSFPSGHACGVFALCCCLAVFARKPVWKIFWLMLAAVASYSRIYLSQHFLLDVEAGSLLGVLCAMLCCRFIKAGNRKERA